MGHTPCSNQRVLKGWIPAPHILSPAGILLQRPHLVKLFEELSAGLMDGADDGAAPLGQGFQEGDHLETGRAIQSAGEAEKERTKPLWATGTKRGVVFYFGVRQSSRLGVHLQGKKQAADLCVSVVHLYNSHFSFSPVLGKWDAFFFKKKNLLTLTLNSKHSWSLLQILFYLLLWSNLHIPSISCGIPINVLQD